MFDKHQLNWALNNQALCIHFAKLSNYKNYRVRNYNFFHKKPSPPLLLHQTLFTNITDKWHTAANQHQLAEVTGIQ